MGKLTKNHRSEDSADGKRRLRVYVIDAGDSVYEMPLEGSLDIGRGKLGEPAPFDVSDVPNAEGRKRLIVAKPDQTHISRHQLILTPLADDRVSVQNTSETQPLSFGDGREALECGGNREFQVPLDLVLGSSLIVRVSRPSEADTLGVLQQESLGPNRSLVSQTHAYIDIRRTSPSDRARLASFSLMLAAVARSNDFFGDVVQGMSELLQVSWSAILQYTDGKWLEVASYKSPRSTGAVRFRASRFLVSSARRMRRVVWYPSREKCDDTDSLRDIGGAIAAPIVDADENVWGAVYGQWQLDGQVVRISESDGEWARSVAAAVAIGLARLDKEQQAVRKQVQFAQFFGEELAEAMERDAQLLDARESAITTLFVDIRGFTLRGQIMLPHDYFRWTQAALEALAALILKHRGVLVDFVGDELFGIWGAPQERDDHASAACRAALEMLAHRAAFNREYPSVHPLDLGIGVTSGNALVGNVGSLSRFKYGARGTTVNLASRVQAMTSELRVPLLVTRDTIERLAEAEFPRRRIGQVQLRGIEAVTDLFEVASGDRPQFSALAAQYEEALRAFEASEFTAAVRALGEVLAQWPEDGPAGWLMQRSAEGMHTGQAPRPWSATK